MGFHPLRDVSRAQSKRLSILESDSSHGQVPRQQIDRQYLELDLTAFAQSGRVAPRDVQLDLLPGDIEVNSSNLDGSFHPGHGQSASSPLRIFQTKHQTQRAAANAAAFRFDAVRCTVRSGVGPCEHV